jgi:hypothetical protein
MRIKSILSFLLVFLGLGHCTIFAQENFSVQINPITNMQNIPKVHSGAFAQWDNKWIFIGGRNNGLHGFLPPFAFPQSGANFDILVYEPQSDQVWSSSLFSLPDSVRYFLGNSNMQFVQKDSLLYFFGGYGWSDVAQGFITYPNFATIDLEPLILAVINGTPIDSYIHVSHDQRIAVCGGEAEFLNNQFHLVFGHRFDGIYSINPNGGFFVQQYTNQIRKFQIDNTGSVPSIINYQTETDTVQFHRRDYNLVPQLFPNGEYGLTAYSGVFLPGINQPFHNSIDVKASGTVVNNTFNQFLNAYTTATLPIWDANDTVMHTLFFGGIAKYVLDLANGTTTVDTLVPFVNTISQVSRFADGSMTETWQPIVMPELLGTNARFVMHPNIPLSAEKIIDLNALSGVTSVGYIIGGIRSPQANISDTDPSVSDASPVVLEVFIDKTISGKGILIEEPARISVHPNPASDFIQISLESKSEKEMSITLSDSQGKVIATLFEGKCEAGKKEINYSVKNLSNGLYYYHLKSGKFSKAEPILIQH